MTEAPRIHWDYNGLSLYSLMDIPTYVISPWRATLTNSFPTWRKQTHFFKLCLTFSLSVSLSLSLLWLESMEWQAATYVFLWKRGLTPGSWSQHRLIGVRPRFHRMTYIPACQAGLRASSAKASGIQEYFRDRADEIGRKIDQNKKGFVQNMIKIRDQNTK